MTNPQCPHGHMYGTCLMCYHDLVAEQQSEMERLKHRLKDQNVVCRDRQTEIEQLRAALKVAQQSLIEFSGAQERGPSWYTNGKDGMYAQIRLWLRRGLAAVQGALGPYDDNGHYEKEKPAAEQEGVLTITRDVTTVSPNFKMTVAVSEAAPQPQRYFTHGDLLKLPADAELDEFGRYEGNEVVYLASAIDREQR